MSSKIYPLYSEGSLEKLHISNQKELESVLSAKVASYDKDCFDEAMREIILADEDPSDTYCFVDYNYLYHQMQKWFTIFKGIQPFYAVKALPDKDIVKIMGDTGCMCFDCASKGEIELVLNAGVKPNHIIYANPPVEHLKYAKNHNILYMTIDNMEEVDKISKIYTNNNAQLIVRIGVDDSHAIVALGSKFGCSVEEGKEIIKHCKELNQNVVGVSFHVGSGCDDVMAWPKALESVKELFDYGINSCGFSEMKYVDIGGGFPGIEGRINCEDIERELRKSLNSLFGEKEKEKNEIVVFAEPGRYFCEPIVTICTYITQVKSGNGKMIYRQNEGVFGVFKDHVLVHAEFVPEVLISDNINGEKGLCTLYGPTSNKKDVIFENLQLPKLSVNDWICYKRYGSYTVSLSSVDITHNIVFLIERRNEEK